MAEMAGLEQTMKTLRFPALRPNITVALMSLADTELQRRVWLGRGLPELGKCASFGDVVHNIYDDTAVGDNLERSIGEVLYDQAEADSLRQITSRIDLMFDKYGGRLPDKDYLNKSEWPEIVDASSNCLALFEENDRRYSRSDAN
jgi:hypothetical protein